MTKKKVVKKKMELKKVVNDVTVNVPKARKDKTVNAIMEIAKGLHQCALVLGQNRGNHINLNGTLNLAGNLSMTGTTDARANVTNIELK